jgi:hypothetical protein
LAGSAAASRALAGGVFSVPLYAVLQTAGEAGSRASAIAANNIINSLFQVSAVLGAGAAVGAGLGVPLVLSTSEPPRYTMPLPMTWVYISRL